MTSQGVITKTRAHSYFPIWVRHRELKQHLPQIHSDALYKSLYTSISRCHSWDGGKNIGSDHGGVLGLDFSPDGTHLVAGCEKNSFLVFDPLSRRLISSVKNAHASYVSHVKFLDSRIFAMGGEDGTVSLWDTRNLKSRSQTLPRHSSTIGNIEFSRKNEMLITSAVDGFIYIWDMKNGNQSEECNNSTFMSHVLLRLRLNPEETKMIMSTANGYLLIVHDLDLSTIGQDLEQFELEMFGSPSLQETNSNFGENSTSFLAQNGPSNRVEVVADFPNPGAFHVISALEIHPQGWSVFSRSKDEKKKQEWTCVHDIQAKEPPWTVPRERSKARGTLWPQRLEWFDEERLSASVERRSTGSLGNASGVFYVGSSHDYVSELTDAVFYVGNEAYERRSGSPIDSERVRNPPPTPSSMPLDILQLRVPRLTHYIEDSHSSDWYIDSLGVSADGRLVCSPSERGIRLLAFSPECAEQSVSWCGTKPRLLYEVSTHTAHSDSVVCTKFSPRHCLLVSGCINGNLTWYQPVV